MERQSLLPGKAKDLCVISCANQYLGPVVESYAEVARRQGIALPC